MSKDTIVLAKLETTEPEHFIKVSIGYEKGGLNYFHGTTSPRGYFLRVQKVKCEQREGYTTESFWLGTSGVKKLLSEAKAFSAKKLDGFNVAVLSGLSEADVIGLVSYELAKDKSVLSDKGMADLYSHFTVA